MYWSLKEGSIFRNLRVWAVKSFQMERPSDEEILRYERQIKNEEIGGTPLVSDILDFTSLEAEYTNGNPIFVKKILALKAQCTGMRTIKKDGNCFYRAFAFRYCELVRSHSGEWHDFILKQAQESKLILSESGYDMSILEDFCDPFFDALKDGDLHKLFTTEYVSDTIVCFLRILTAAFLKKVQSIH